MRDAFIGSIYKVTQSDDRVLCLVGDIGAYLLRNYIKDFPDHFYNLGAAEANMIGVAAGLALSGKIPFVYTITPFVTSRCFEQIKDDICYNGANVKLVGVGSGVSYGTMGPTHHSLEDVAIMRSLPGMTVLSPADPKEVEEAVRAAARHVGPVYIRLTLKAEPLNYRRTAFKIGKGRMIRQGKEAAIIASGEMVGIAVTAAEDLERTGIKCFVINMSTLKPIDEGLIRKLSKDCRAIISLEEHSIIGGLGSAVADVLSQLPENKARFRIIGFKDTFCRVYASDKNILFDKYGLSCRHITSVVRNLLYDQPHSRNRR